MTLPLSLNAGLSLPSASRLVSPLGPSSRLKSTVRVPVGEMISTWMGSWSVYPRAGLGRLLTEGDRLPLTEYISHQSWLAGRSYFER
ncbi:MAG: hypothetical protein P8Y37_11520, partial [Anaerolineales bacterium]